MARTAARLGILMVAMTLARVAASQAPAAPGGTAQAPPMNLEGTSWKAVELYGTRVTSPWPSPSREPHLTFGAGQLSGADGCNLLRGPFTQNGVGVSFGALAGTQMACRGIDDQVPRRFRNALQGTSHWSLVKERLELYGATGKPLAVFVRRDAAPSARSPLAGTTWRLVRFEGGDDRVLTPASRAEYTLAFDGTGAVAARVDCNRGRATWKADAAGRLELGPLLLTRAKCPDASLHDQIVKQWPSIRSFVLKDGRLFLSLMADGGTYEFEPVAPRR